MAEFSPPYQSSGVRYVYFTERSQVLQLPEADFQLISQTRQGCVTKLLSEARCTVTPCSFVTADQLHPDSAIRLFVVYLCKRRGYYAFYDLCNAFDMSDDVRVKIKDTNSSCEVQCFDVLHRVYHHHNEQLTLATIKTTLSKYSDELRQIISDYNQELVI